MFTLYLLVLTQIWKTEIQLIEFKFTWPGSCLVKSFYAQSQKVISLVLISSINSSVHDETVISNTLDMD